MAIIPNSVRENPWVRTAVMLLMLVGLLAFTIWIRDILLPFFLAFIIAYMLDPLVDWLELKLGLGRTVAVIVLLTTVGLVAVGFLYYLADQTLRFASELGKLADDPPELSVWFETMLPEVVHDYFTGMLSELNPREITRQSIEYARSHVSGIADTLSQGSTYLWLVASRTFGALGAVLNLGVVIIVSIYLLRDFDRLIAYLRTLVPHSYRAEIDAIVGDIDGLLRAFFRGYLIVCVILGFLFGLGYEFVGLEGGFLVGMLSGLLSIVPYIGPALGFLVALAMGFYQFGPSVWILGIVAVYSLAQFLEGNFLTPKIVGEAVGLNPVVIMFALMLFAKILGFLGLLLAIPLAAIAKVLLGRLLDQYRDSSFFQPS